MPIVLPPLAPRRQNRPSNRGAVVDRHLLPARIVSEEAETRMGAQVGHVEARQRRARVRRDTALADTPSQS